MFLLFRSSISALKSVLCVLGLVQSWCCREVNLPTHFDLVEVRMREAVLHISIQLGLHIVVFDHVRGCYFTNNYSPSFFISLVIIIDVSLSKILILLHLVYLCDSILWSYATFLSSFKTRHSCHPNTSPDATYSTRWLSSEQCCLLGYDVV